MNVKYIKLLVVFTHQIIRSSEEIFSNLIEYQRPCLIIIVMCTHNQIITKYIIYFTLEM